jgi:hypothetical protein
MGKTGWLGLLGALLFGAQGAAALPILDGGWSYDQVDAASADSIGSPYDFTLAGPAWLRITDLFGPPGDGFSVYDFDALVLTTAPHSGAPFGDDAVADYFWAELDWESGEVLLAAGVHRIRVQGDGATGLPSGFSARLDSAQSFPPASTPEPSSLLMVMTGLVGLGFAGRRVR